MPRWKWVLRQFTRRLWARASLIGILGVVAAMLAMVAERYIPWELPGSIGADAVGSILNIIASSMLAVTTFSLSVMTSAYGSATSNVTPRATRLLMEDRVTQNVLSTFIGSFLFGIVGIVVLQTGSYGERGRVILFVVTIGVIVLIVVSLLRWIDHLIRLGRVGETTRLVEEAAAQAIQAYKSAPFLGGKPMPGGASGIPENAQAISSAIVGYVQHVDIPALSRLSETLERDIHVAALPGTFVYPHTPLLWLSREMNAGEMEEMTADLRNAFSIGPERSFDHDPRFGLAVMCEIASRALSPATNDSGTAIDVIGRTTRLMCLWADVCRARTGIAVDYPTVHVPPLDTHDLFEDAFMLISRDGAGLVEVQLRLQKSLRALGRIDDDDFRAAARHHAKLALARAEAKLTLDADRQRLREVVDSFA